MQHVKRQWLSLYACLLLGIDVLLIVSFYLFNVRGIRPDNYAQWGVTPLILVIAIIHAVYIIGIFPFIRKKSEWLGSLISGAIFAFLLAALIETSHYNNLIIRIGYMLFVFSLAAIGPFMPIATVVLTWVFLLYTYLNVLNNIGGEISLGFEIVLDIFVTLAGVLGWLTFRKYYVKKKDQETMVLSRLLEQEQFKSNVMLESITDGVMVINTKGTVQVLNESAARMLGWYKEEALKLDYHSLINPFETEPQTNRDHKTVDLIADTIASKRACQRVVLLQTKNNHQIFVDIVVSPILETIPQRKTDSDASTEPDKQLVGVIAVLRDVDEQKRQEQQRSDFISTASHEMRTPVASIQGFIELALNPKVAVIDEKARGYLIKAQDATKHLSGLFQDLLTVSKSDDGRLTNNPEVIDVAAFLRDLVEQNKLIAEQKGLKVVFDTGENGGKTVAPLMYISADPERLREVFTNLFDNAVKYTAAGIVTVGASLKERGVVIRVSDTGMGIAAEDIPHLFQKFYRTDNSETREIGGTGLGLYICKQITEMMGGKIWVESTPRVGSTFFVEIPRVNPSTT